MLNGSEIYIVILIVLAILGGIVNTYQLIHFIKQSKSRFLSSRNPPLIILYCIISLMTAFTTTPVDLYYHGLHSADTPFFAKFATEFFHEFCTIMLLVIVFCRSWMLYYDYKFSESSSDEIWRNIVNPNDNNFWIKNRKTLGNLHFIVCIALIVDSISLLAMSIIGAFVLKAENSKIFHFFSLFGLGIPFYLFIIYLLLYKIQLINDVYLIHKELKYLSLCIIVRIIAFTMDLLFLNPYDEYLLFYTVEVLTTFLSVWIQCWWVLNKLKKIEKEKDLDLYLSINVADSNNRNRNEKNKNLLTMIDIFAEQTSFEIFIRHCTHELSVESVLFLIEISQFKATLYKYNAFGVEALNDRFVNVINTNIVKYIKQKRAEKMNKQLVFHPLYENNNSNNNKNNNNNNSTTNNSLSPVPAATARPNQLLTLSNVTISSNHTTPSASPLGSPISSPSNRSDITIELKSLRSEICPVASIKQESDYSHFQQTVLNKKWLPLNKLLFGVRERERSKTKSKDHSHASHNNTTEKSKTMTTTAPTMTPPLGALTKSKSLTKSNTITIGHSNTIGHTKFIPSANTIHMTPISLAVINDSNAHDHDDTEEKKDEKSPTNSGHKSIDTNVTVDVNWIYEYGKYLYLKYVDDSANLSINVSHSIRKDLWCVFSKESSQEAFQKIQLLHHELLTKISHLNPKEEQLFIQTYLYHAFDFAFHSVWSLLKSDTFYRFQKAKQYKILCQEADKEKIQNAKCLRDTEYSQSYKKSQIDII